MANRPIATLTGRGLRDLCLAHLSRAEMNEIARAADLNPSGPASVFLDGLSDGAGDAEIARHVLAVARRLQREAMSTDGLERLKAAYAKATPGPYAQCGRDRGGCSCGWIYGGGAIPLKALLREEDLFELTAEQQAANGACAVALHNSAPELFAAIEAADRLHRAVTEECRLAAAGASVNSTTRDHVARELHSAWYAYDDARAKIGKSSP